MDEIKERIQSLTLKVQLSEDESRRLDTFLQKRGLKKGFFVREAILRELDRREAQEAQEKAAVS